MAKKLKYIPFVFLIIIAGVLTLSYIKGNPNPYPNQVADSEIPSYSEVKLPHNHNYNGAKYLPVVGSAAIDIDNDGISEIFIGGGENQDDKIYKYSEDGFSEISTIKFNKDMDDATYGANVIDINKDGLNDLLIARESGGYIYINNGESFSGTKFDVHMNSKSRSLTFAIADLNNDGHIDLFVSAYLTRSAMEGQNIFNQEGYGASSVLLINNGDNTFRDITTEAGMDYIHNTFLGIFVDMDNDNDLDLVVAHDTGVVKTWKNNGDLTFTDTKNPFSDMLGYPMGIAAGDYNNDGEVDFYFSNVGPTAPRFLAKGDITDDQVFYTDLMLMKGNGDMTFERREKEAKLAIYEFSWGTTMGDLNLDGKQDIIISENYVDFPLHKIFKLPGRVLLQNKDQTFAPIETQAGVENRSYEIAAILADFNGDGYPDQVRVNLDGVSKAFISKKGKNNFYKVKMPVTAEFLGSKVTLTLSDGSKLYDWFVSGEGLCSEQERIMTFGLGQDLEVASAMVLMPNDQTLSKNISGKNDIVEFEL